MAKRKTGQQQSPVQFTRTEVSNLLPAYYMIRDAIEGEQAIKGIIGGISGGISGSGNGGIPLVIDNIVLTRAARYLPQPNAEDKSQQNLERYRAYVTRAVFYNVTGRTLEGMAGQIFLRDPVADIPEELKPMQLDTDGGGLNLNQAAYRAVRHCIAYGRTGILVDFPVTNAPVTKAATDTGEIHPTFTIYNPWDIINWRIEQVNAKKVLTFLVLREVIDEEGDDGFQLTTIEQYRVLTLDPQTGNHVVEIFQKGSGGFGSLGQTFPKDASGKPLQFIPFMFIGSENNDISPNKPPLYDLASVNISHYRNSADYEEACFICGQPTPVLVGLTEDWVKNILKGAVTLGSRASIALPVGASAELLQALPNGMPIEAMKHKEEQMVALGAKLVQKANTPKSATEKIIETTSESSVLANIAANVSAAFEWGLGIALSFLTTTKTVPKYQLNKDFDLTSMTADDQNAIIKEWQSAAISFSEMRSAMRKAGIATQEDEQARTEIQKDIADGMIPDPTLTNAPPTAVPDAKAASSAGGPQPKQIRRASSPN